jgi:hypothetical protein
MIKIGKIYYDMHIQKWLFKEENTDWDTWVETPFEKYNYYDPSLEDKEVIVSYNETNCLWYVTKVNTTYTKGTKS